MICKEETELKEKLKTYGFNLKALCNSIGIRYSTLGQYLNGFSPMPNEVREKIERLIEDRESIDDNT